MKNEQARGVKGLFAGGWGGGEDKQKKRAFQILRSSRGVNLWVEVR